MSKWNVKCQTSRNVKVKLSRITSLVNIISGMNQSICRQSAWVAGYGAGLGARPLTQNTHAHRWRSSYIVHGRLHPLNMARARTKPCRGVIAISRQGTNPRSPPPQALGSLGGREGGEGGGNHRRFPALITIRRSSNKASNSILPTARRCNPLRTRAIAVISQSKTCWRSIPR